MDAATPSPGLRRRALRDACLTLIGVTGVALALVSAVGLTLAAIPKALSIPILLFALVGRHLGDHPLDHLGPANHLTLARALVVAPLAAFVGEASAESYSWILVGIAGFAFVMDWVDGRVARATGTASPFGARLDMELDGLTVLVLCALAVGLDRAGPGVLLAGVARYLFVAAGWVWPFMAAELPSDPRRAVACGLGVTALVACLAPWWLWWLGPGLAWSGALILVGSFGIDVVWLWRRR